MLYVLMVMLINSKKKTLNSKKETQDEKKKTMNRNALGDDFFFHFENQIALRINAYVYASFQVLL